MSEIATTPRLHVPKVGDTLTADLPSERTRAEVLEVRDSDHILVRLVQVMMSREHRYQRDQRVWCERVRGVLGERWEATNAT